MKTLLDLFKSLESRSGRPAIIYRTGIRRFVYSYIEVFSLSLRFASWLKQQGVGRGDRIILWAPNSPWWAVSFLGATISGVVVVPVDFVSGKDKTQKILDLTQAKLIIQSQYKLDAFHDSRAVNIEELEHLLINVDQVPIAELQISPSELALLVYTSGTTGDPKGVMLSHENLVANLKQVNQHIKIDSSHNFLSLLPLSHMFEQTCGFLSPLYLGSSIIYLRTLKPAAILEAFGEEEVYVSVLVPRLLQLLKDSIEREFENKKLGPVFRAVMCLSRVSPFGLRKYLLYPVSRKFGKNFKFFVSGGAPLSVEVGKFWQSLGFKVIEGYGLTEASPILTANTLGKQVLGTVGLPLPGVEIKLVEGEIVAKGDNVFGGYYQNEEATSKLFTSDGWLKTGDLGEFNSDCYLTIKGRSKDVIVTAAGINVYPSDVESVLHKIEGVKECCVLAVDQGEGDEVYASLILGGDEYRPEEIIQAANNRLDAEQRITGYSLWPHHEFPKTSTLKIQKFLVKKEIEKDHGEHSEFVSKDKLLNLIGRVTGKPAEEIKEDSIIVRDLGLTSIARLELVNFIELEYRMDLDDNMITQNTSVSDLRKLIVKREKFKVKSHLRFWPNKPWARFVRSISDKLITYPGFKYYLKVNTENEEIFKNLKPPVIFIANHLSFADHSSIYLALQGRWHTETATASWEEFFFPVKKVSKFERVMRRLAFEAGSLMLNLFPISQVHGFRGTLGFMGKLIDNNINILIFPEGTRSKTGELLPFMPGIGLMVKELKVPVVPIKITGVEKVLHVNMSWPKPGKVKVKFGTPLIFSNETPSEIVERCREVIEKL